VYSKTLSCVFEKEKIHVDSTSSFSVYVCANISHVKVAGGQLHNGSSASETFCLTFQSQTLFA